MPPQFPSLKKYVSYLEKKRDYLLGFEKDLNQRGLLPRSNCF
jgi:hypothetical protein